MRGPVGSTVAQSGRTENEDERHVDHEGQCRVGRSPRIVKTEESSGDREKKPASGDEGEADSQYSNRAASKQHHGERKEKCAHGLQ